jgi:HK97 family phage prohead protease
MEIERRAFAAEGLHIEKREKGERRLVGHAAVFNSLSEDLGGFREQIIPGAFADAITTDDVRALFNHDPNFVLGRNRSKTLRLAEDARGLAIEIILPDTQTVNDLVVAPIERGDVSQMSFAFAAKPGGQDWAKDDEGRVIRSLKKVRLFDVSPVTYPAYQQTDIAVRSFAGFCSERLAAGDDTVNEIRKLMKLPPIPGGDRKAVVPMNLLRAQEMLARTM